MGWKQVVSGFNNKRTQGNFGRGDDELDLYLDCDGGHMTAYIF